MDLYTSLTQDFIEWMIQIFINLYENVAAHLNVFVSK